MVKVSMHHTTAMIYLVTIYAALTMETVADRMPKIPCSVLDHTYYHKQHGGCLQCEQCNPGEEQMDVQEWASKMPAKIFTIHGPTQCPTCTACGKGYFNPGRAYKCRPCGNCTLHNQYEVQKCTSTSDAVCDGVLPEKRYGSEVVLKKDGSTTRISFQNTHIVTILVTITFSLVVCLIIGVLLYMAYKRRKKNRGTTAEDGWASESVSGMQETETTFTFHEELNQTNTKELPSVSPTVSNGKKYSRGLLKKSSVNPVTEGRTGTRHLSSTPKRNGRNGKGSQSSPSSTDDETKPLIDDKLSSKGQRRRYKSESSYERPKKEGKFQRQISEPGLSTDVVIDGDNKSIHLNEKMDKRTIMLLGKLLCEGHQYITFARMMGLDDVTIHNIKHDHKDSGIEETSYQVLTKLQEREKLVYKRDVTKTLQEMGLIHIMKQIVNCQ